MPAARIERLLLSVNPLRKIIFLLLLSFANAAEYGISVSTYLGDTSDTDATKGVKIAADGTIVTAVNMGAADPGNGATIRTYLNGATTNTPGVVMRLSADGKTVISITRIAAALYDMGMDSAGNIYLAAGLDGFIKLNPTATSILNHHLSGSFIARCDVSASGQAVALQPTTPANLEGNSGPGTIHTLLPPIPLLRHLPVVTTHKMFALIRTIARLFSLVTLWLIHLGRQAIRAIFPCISPTCVRSISRVR